MLNKLNGVSSVWLFDSVSIDYENSDDIPVLRYAFMQLILLLLRVMKNIPLKAANEMCERVI